MDTSQINLTKCALNPFQALTLPSRSQTGTVTDFESLFWEMTTNVHLTKTNPHYYP
jgi:hypothetical protein